MIANLQGSPFMVGGATPPLSACAREREREREREVKRERERVEERETERGCRWTDEGWREKEPEGIFPLLFTTRQPAGAALETHVFRT